MDWSEDPQPRLTVVPGTEEGIAAIEEATADGINVNVTLLFKVESYEAIAEARKRCKEFLTDMAAINYWLIRKTGSGETLPEVIRRYRSPEVFAVDTAIR